MKSLIIAEKPNLAKTIVSALKLLKEDVKNVKEGNDFYYESENYLVCSARGHLYTLYDVDDYLKLKTNWSLEQLPFFPKAFQWKPISDATSYIKTIKKLLKRNDVNCVINAGDAAREGEYLIRLILNQLNNHHPVKRLWMPSQVPEEIKNNILTMKDDSEYDGLYNEGLARSLADWMDGINLTRYATLRAGGFLRVGRVASTIVKLIYLRDKEIKEFVPEHYYQVISNVDYLGTKIKLVSEEEFEIDEKPIADRYASILNKNICVVSDIEQKDRVIAPPKPFSQSKLQNYMNEVHNFSPNTTLEIAQKLYEGGYITYPRTDSEYIEEARFEMLERVAGRLIQQGHNLELNKKDKIFNDSKISDHGAILPTINLPKIDELSDKEKLTYNAILNRFLAYFCKDDCISSDTKVVFSVGDIETFELKGHTIKQEGWRKYELKKTNDVLIPKLNIGDKVPINFKTIEAKTSPKKHYSVTTLNNYLENPLRTLKGESDEAQEEAIKNILDGCSIGTAASLSGIIEKICKDELIMLDSKTYKILPKGEFLIQTLDKLNINIDTNKTIEMNKQLKKINSGELDIRTYLNEVKSNISNIITESSKVQLSGFEKPTNVIGNKVIGKCPRCQDDVIEKTKGFFCNNVNCKFALFIDNLWWKTRKKELTATMVKSFLQKKQTWVEGLYSEKTGKTYNAIVEMNDDGASTRFALKFDNKK